MAMVGMRLKTADGLPMVDDQILNAVVIMILFTCVISSIITESSARSIILRDKEIPQNDNTGDDEKILIPVKYPEYADQLVNMALLMRNPKLKRSLVALNVSTTTRTCRRTWNGDGGCWNTCRSLGPRPTWGCRPR